MELHSRKKVIIFLFVCGLAILQLKNISTIPDALTTAGDADERAIIAKKRHSLEQDVVLDIEEGVSMKEEEQEATEPNNFKEEESSQVQAQALVEKEEEIEKPLMDLQEDPKSSAETTEENDDVDATAEKATKEEFNKSTTKPSDEKEEEVQSKNLEQGMESDEETDKQVTDSDEETTKEIKQEEQNEDSQEDKKGEGAPSQVEAKEENDDATGEKAKGDLDKNSTMEPSEKEEEVKSVNLEQDNENDKGKEKSNSENVTTTEEAGVKSENPEQGEESNEETEEEKIDSEKATATEENEPEKQEAEKEKPLIEECGCPHTDKVKHLMKDLGHEDCTPSDCTNYKLDTSTLEKPETAFEHYEKVVMVTKVLWPEDLGRLQQMLCLFNAAYNRHAGYYDIVVFTTLPWTEEQIKDLQDVAYPAKLTVVVDSPPLEDVLETMTEDEIDYLKTRCGCAKNETLGWFHQCRDGRHVNNLGYSWQAEFRAYHLWTQPVLADYKYMIWMDSDSLPTKMWYKDPMKVMVENDLVLMFDNFPGGGAQSGEYMNEKIYKAYNKTFSAIILSPDGRLKVKYNDSPKGCDDIPQVHGFHHITDLDFYRSERTQNFLKILVEDYKFSRKYDDQIAVTIPAEMDAPEKAWDYRMNGLNFGIHHNGDLDGKEKNVVFGYHRFHWERNRKVWIAGAKMCNAWIIDRGSSSS